MAKHKKDNKSLQDILRLCEEIDRLDVADDELFDDKGSIPYTSKVRPDPQRWENKGIKHKLL